MAQKLQKPSINRIIPPDPNSSFSIEFQYSGEQFRAHRAIIIDADTYTTVYDKRQIGTSRNHIVPEKTLTAGKRYVTQVQVFDSENESQGNSSPLSDQMPFYCFTTPVFKFSNIKNGEVVKSASISPSLSYSQAENETIRDYQIALYDQFQILVASHVYYGEIEGSCTFYSLENNKMYYVRATGETTNGIPLDTDYIQINVSYSQMPATSVFTLENVYDGGYINIQTSIKDIKFEAVNCTLENGILTIENGSLIYSKGISIKENGYIGIGVQSLPTGEFIKCKSSKDDMFTITLEKICGTYYFWLKSDNYNIFAPLNSEYIKQNKTYKGSGGTVTLYDLAPDGYQLYLEIIRKNLIYDLRVNYIEK